MSQRSGVAPVSNDADLSAVAAMLVVYFSHVVTRRAVVDTSVEHVLYEVVSVALMLVIARRAHLKWLAMPVVPMWVRKVVPVERSARVLSMLVCTAIVISLTDVARLAGRAAGSLGFPSAGCEGVADGSCCTYNDSACSGDGLAVDVVEVFTASVGEELAFRYAFLVIVARVAGVRFAIVAQAIVWGLSHTGFDRGYGADVVAGLIVAGLVSAVAVLMTGSVWPVVAAHAFYNFGVVARDHDLELIVWATTATYIVSTIFCAAVVSTVAVRSVTRRGAQVETRVHD